MLFNFTNFGEKLKQMINSPRSKTNILVVDDDTAGLIVLRNNLKDDDFNLYVADTGTKALEIIQHNKIDIVVLDIMLPDYDGFEICAKLKYSQATKDIPVIFLTALAEPENIVKGFKKGGVDYITKPYKKEELLVRIKTQVELIHSREIINNQIDLLEKQKLALESEKRKTKNLLLNILPAKIVKELEVGYKPKPEYFKLATIMFTDFIGFSSSCSSIPPELLVNTLETYFTGFDSIIEKYNIEKIKTIGDAYMCASGIPIPNNTHAIEIVLAALEIRNLIEVFKNESHNTETFLWDIRIGINTGEVIAGVIGKTKFAYDVWGDTVNTASNTELLCEVNKLSITESTYELVKDFFVCSKRGNYDLKNTKNTDIYVVERLKPEFSSDESGIFPSEAFRKMVNEIM